MKAPSPTEFPKFDIADAAALKALEKGTASPEQQQRALKFIVERVSDVYNLSYRPDSSRETDFAEGKRFVGLTIIALLRKDLEKLKQQKEKSIDSRKPRR